jgi:hypothetical protein
MAQRRWALQAAEKSGIFCKLPEDLHQGLKPFYFAALTERSKTLPIPFRICGSISVAPTGLLAYCWPFPGLRFACPPPRERRPVRGDPGPGLFSFGPSGADTAEAFSSTWVGQRPMEARLKSCPDTLLPLKTLFTNFSAACLAPAPFN